MANPEHLALLRQGTEVWNQWRSENPSETPQLSSARMDEMVLIDANLRRANLAGARLHKALLQNADLTHANLSRCELNGAIFTGCTLEDAGLFAANLEEARIIGTRIHRSTMAQVNLKAAELNDVDLLDVNLAASNLRQSSIYRTTLRHVRLKDADMTDAKMFGVTFAHCDLGLAIGLETIRHSGPSSVGCETLVSSAGNIPTDFLRGCGVPEILIEYSASLRGKPTDFYSCFISYSSKDAKFAQHLHDDLQTKGVRCWLDKEDLKIGDKFRVTIDETIRVYDKLLLVLSEHSVQSDWVEKEVETAMERERDQKRTMLFPIRLDTAVMDIKTGWPADIRRTRQIGDFTNWRNRDAYGRAFERLLRDLKAESNSRKS